jgi:hypothetical protein
MAGLRELAPRTALIGQHSRSTAGSAAPQRDVQRSIELNNPHGWWKALITETASLLTIHHLKAKNPPAYRVIVPSLLTLCKKPSHC